MTEGWIKLHRQIEEWEWYRDVNTCHLFIHLLFRANHKPQKWQGIMVKTGQLITSYAHLSQQTGLSVRNIRTCLEHLKNTGETTSQPTNRFTLITVVNYRKYQLEDTKPTSQPSLNRQATDKQPTTNKNDKNEKNEKNPLRGVWGETEKWLRQNSIGNPQAWLRKLIAEADETSVRKAWSWLKRSCENPTTNEFWCQAIRLHEANKKNL